MSGLRDCGIHTYRAVHEGNASVAVIAARDGVNCIEDRNVDNRYCSARTAGPQLLAEHSNLTGCDRRVIQAGGVDCDLIPVAQTCQCVIALAAGKWQSVAISNSGSVARSPQ